VAEATPELIFKQPIDITVGITDENSTFLATSLGFIPGTAGHKEAKSVVEKIYKLFREHDCTLLEVKRLAETTDDRVVVCGVTMDVAEKYKDQGYVCILLLQNKTFYNFTYHI
jgi:succinyl-CoA synthetase beta subunit